MFHEQLAQLVDRRDLAVVLLLPRDVSGYRLDRAWANAQGGVTSLPTERSAVCERDPPRLRRSSLRPQSPHGAADVVVEILAPGVCDHGSAAARGEHDVNVESRIGRRHGGMMAPLRGARNSGPMDWPGVFDPGLVGCDPSGVRPLEVGGHDNRESPTALCTRLPASSSRRRRASACSP